MSRFSLMALVTALAGVAILPAQQAAGTIQALGNASLSVKPDQAQFTVSVSTDAATAQQAAQQNATQTTQVITALQQMLGSNGTIRTVGYSENPRYSNGTIPTLVGYTVVNSIQVTTYNLSNPGALIDAASQNGATNVGGLTFGLQDPDPTKQLALTAASKQALAHAGAMASGLGAKAGPVVSAQESASATPVPGVAGAASTTPIQTGYVTVSASVTVTVQLQ